MLKSMTIEFKLNDKIGVLVKSPLFERVIKYLYYTTSLGEWFFFILENVKSCWLAVDFFLHGNEVMHDSYDSISCILGGQGVVTPLS